MSTNSHSPTRVNVVLSYFVTAEQQRQLITTMLSQLAYNLQLLPRTQSLV